MKILLSSFNSNELNNFISFLVFFLKKKLKIINLPKKKKIFNILKSPHTDKDSRDQYEINLLKKVIYIKINRIKFINFIYKINVPVDISLTII
ncbi:30S ribosomal protein S10 [Candidatus Vidania fulgoroideorum]